LCGEPVLGLGTSFQTPSGTGTEVGVAGGIPVEVGVGVGVAGGIPVEVGVGVGVFFPGRVGLAVAVGFTIGVLVGEGVTVKPTVGVEVGLGPACTGCPEIPATTPMMAPMSTSGPSCIKCLLRFFRFVFIENPPAPSATTKLSIARVKRE
jgi:hypothetical protein